MNLPKKVLIFGSGSIALRHAENLRSEGLEVLVYTKRKIKKEFFFKQKKIFVIDNLNKLNWKNILFGVIANKTYLHEKFIKILLNKKKDIFCEKPTVINLKNIKNLRNKIIKSDVNFYVNYQLRQHSFLEKFRNLISKEKIVYTHVKVAHDINKWRKNGVRKKSYFIQKKLGGGVIFELVHEINLINYLFGKITKIKTIKNSYNYSKCEDQAMSLFKTDQNVTGFLYQDMISKNKLREIEVVTKNSKKLLFDLVKNRIFIYQNNKKKKLKLRNGRNKHNDLIKRNTKFFLRLIAKNSRKIKYFDESINDIKICKKMHNDYK